MHPSSSALVAYSKGGVGLCLVSSELKPDSVHELCVCVYKEEGFKSIDAEHS